MIRDKVSSETPEIVSAESLLLHTQEYSVRVVFEILLIIPRKVDHDILITLIRLSELRLCRPSAGTCQQRVSCCIIAFVIPCRSEEHTSELQSRGHVVYRLL